MADEVTTAVVNYGIDRAAAALGDEAVVGDEAVGAQGGAEEAEDEEIGTRGGLVDKTLTVVHVTLDVIFCVVLVVWGWQFFAAREVAASLETTGDCPDAQACSSSAWRMVGLGILPPLLAILGLCGVESGAKHYCLRLEPGCEDDKIWRIVFWLLNTLIAIFGIAIASWQIYAIQDACHLSGRVMAAAYVAAPRLSYSFGY